MTWTDQAACRGMPNRVFYPGPTAPDRAIPDQLWNAARTICARCPVRTECLNDTLKHETNTKGHGMFGGYTPNERAKLADMTPRQRIAEDARRRTEAA